MPFAPTPIQIRYGNNGMLLQAASSMGRPPQFDLGILSQMNQQYAQRQQMEQANQLQMAHAQMLAQQQPAAPADPLYFEGNGVNDINQQLRDIHLQNAQDQGLDGHNLDILSTLAKNQHVDPHAFGAVAQEMTKTATAKQNETDDSSAKAAYLKGISGSVAADDAQALAALASDPRVKATDFRTAADQAVNRAKSYAQKQTQQTVSGLNAQERNLRQRMEVAEKRLNAMGYTPDTNPSQLVATQPNLNGRTHGLGFFGNIADTFAPGSVTPTAAFPPTPADADKKGSKSHGQQASDAYREYWQMKRELDGLQGQRTTAVASDVPPRATAPLAAAPAPDAGTLTIKPSPNTPVVAQTPGTFANAIVQSAAPAATPDAGQPAAKGKLSDPAVAAQYLKTAGGDKDKARQLAQQDGWSI